MLDISTASITVVSANIDISNANISIDPTLFIQKANTDAFGRQRVSEPYTLFEFNSILGKNPYYINEQINGSGATSTASIGRSYTSMQVYGPPSSIVRQSREYILYQPGKSKLLFMTGVLAMRDISNVVTRIGCFDANMGIYIQNDGGGISLVEHQNGTYNTIPRAQWDNSLNSLGINFNNAQIYTFDLEWLGVGQIRCGVIWGGEFYYYHTITHQNALVQPYFTMAKLPLRYEISSTATLPVGVTGEMRMICGTAISEGGVTPLTKSFQYNNFTDPSGLTLDGRRPYKPIMAVGLTTSPYFNRTSIKITGLELININGSNNNNQVTSVGSWKLVINPPIISGSIPWQNYSSWAPTPFASESASMVATNRGNFPVFNDAAGYILKEGTFSSRISENYNTSVDSLVNLFSLSSPINSGATCDYAVLFANTLYYNSGGGAEPPSLFGTMTIQEFI